MKTKTLLSIFVVSILCCGSLSAQHQDLSYYYKGNLVSLNLNTQYFLVYADAEKTSREKLEKEFRITEQIEFTQFADRHGEPAERPDKK